MPQARTIDVSRVTAILDAIRGGVATTIHNDPMPSKRLIAAIEQLDILRREIPSGGFDTPARETTP